MKASELRIGNLVLCEGEVAEIKVLDGRTNDVLVHIGKRERCGKVDKLQPIPLTHRAMESLGFVYARSSFWHQDLENYDFCSIGLSEWEIIRNTGDYEYDTVEKVVSTLHDLQNYYFVLTGEELQIDEDKLKQATTNDTNQRRTRRANQNDEQACEQTNKF